MIEDDITKRRWQPEKEPGYYLTRQEFGEIFLALKDEPYFMGLLKGIKERSDAARSK